MEIVKPSKQEIERYKSHYVTPIFFKELKNFDVYYPRLEHIVDISVLKEVQDLDLVWTRGAVIEQRRFGKFIEYDYCYSKARLIIASKDLKLESKIGINPERIVKWDKSKDLVGFKIVKFGSIQKDEYITYFNFRAYPVYTD